MNFDDYRAIAKNVILTAADLDHRIRDELAAIPDDQATRRFTSWATVFAGRTWPTEAIEAVGEHYARPNAFRLMPGDVVTYCDNQPVWSSTEHARDWVLRVGVQNPYSGSIEAYSGITEPVIDIPESVTRDGERAWLIDQLSAWARPRLDEIANAIVERRYEPWWRGGDESQTVITGPWLPRGRKFDRSGSPSTGDAS